MKYFSELTNRVYDTEDELHEAEKPILEQKNKESEYEAKIAEFDEKLKALSQSVKEAEDAVTKVIQQYMTVATQKFDYLKEHGKLEEIELPGFISDLFDKIDDLMF